MSCRHSLPKQGNFLRLQSSKTTLEITRQSSTLESEKAIHICDIATWHGITAKQAAVFYREQVFPVRRKFRGPGECEIAVENLKWLILQSWLIFRNLGTSWGSRQRVEFSFCTKWWPKFETFSGSISSEMGEQMMMRTMGEILVFGTAFAIGCKLRRYKANWNTKKSS